MSGKFRAKISSRTAILTISLTAIFIAMNTVITCLITVPMPLPSGQGYLNLSDALTMLVAGMIHPLIGALVGAVSGTLSDLLLGFGAYAPFTFVVKAAEALAVGYFLRLMFRRAPRRVGLVLVLPSFVFGGILMMGGYFLSELIMFRNLGIAVADLIGNLIQGLVGAAVGGVLFYGLYRLPILRELGISANASFLTKIGA